MSSLIPKEASRGNRDGKSAFSRGRRNAPRPSSGLACVMTFAVAAAADGIQVAFPPLWIPTSIVAALILFFIWGWRWEILVVLVPELAPAIGLFPSWVAVALYLTGRDAVIGSTSVKDPSKMGDPKDRQ